MPALATNDELFSLSLEQILEVNITSRRFNESFRDVSRPISVFSNQVLQENQIDSIYDLADLVPNVSFHRSFGRWQERPVMRGISAVSGAPIAGILVDGVSVSDIAPTLSMHDIEQVEVLRGPEAALFGRSTFAGAINFVSRRPSKKTEADFEFQSANNNGVESNLWLSAPIADNFLFALSGKYASMDDNEDNTLGSGGDGIGEEETNMLSLSSQWQVSPKMSFYYKGTYQQDRDGQLNVYLQNSESNNCFLDSRPQYFCGEIQSPSQIGYSHLDELWDFHFKKDIQRQHIEFNYQGSEKDFKLVYNYFDVEIDVHYDGDFYELDSVFSSTDIEKQAKNLEFISNFYFPRARLLFGGAYTKLDRTDVFDTQFLIGGTLFPSNPSAISNDIDNYALFASVDYKLLPSVKLNIDLRYAMDKIEYKTASGFGEQEQWQAFSPRVNLSKTFENGKIIYASIAQGQKPGGFNTTLEDRSFIDESERERVLTYLAFDEENLTSYDLGFRGELASTRSYLSTNIFFYDWKDLQLVQSLSYRNDQNNTVRTGSTINGGSAQTLGGEIELESFLSDHFRSRISLGYVSTELKNTDTTAHEDLTGQASVDGKDVPNVPQLTGFLGLYFSQSVFTTMQLKANAGARYESERYVAEHNYAEIGDTLKIDLSVSLSNRHWALTLWGKNVNDDDTPESVARFGDAATFFVRRGFGISMPERRQYGLSLRYSY